MNAALKALLHVVQDDNAKTLFLNAQYYDGLSQNVTLQQFFKPYVDVLEANGLVVQPELPEDEVYERIWILLPKNAVEAPYLVARAVSCLAPDGTVYCAAENKAGGKRINQWMQQCGFESVSCDARYKSKVCWGRSSGVPDQMVDQFTERGHVQTIFDSEFFSQPGVFGWNKKDSGSQILLQHLPDNLSGVGADFGCGYGYLSRHVLDLYHGVKHLWCADADYRAVQLCAKNVANFESVEFLWCDLTVQQTDLQNLDFIIMNPPFHEGRRVDVSLGIDFIKTAHRSLKKGGELWMVANAHLPYECVLEGLFAHCKKIAKQNGFKIFKAEK